MRARTASTAYCRASLIFFGLEGRVFLQDLRDGHAVGDHADDGGDGHP